MLENCVACSRAAIKCGLTASDQIKIFHPKLSKDLQIPENAKFYYDVNISKVNASTI